jgi:hypothetical protein
VEGGLMMRFGGVVLSVVIGFDARVVDHTNIILFRQEIFKTDGVFSILAQR